MWFPNFRADSEVEDLGVYAILDLRNSFEPPGNSFPSL